jgi:hypothetical protein
VQILAYADDINIIGRTLTVMTEAFLTLERESRKMGLIITVEKMKYMFAGQKNNILLPEIKINGYTLERVDSFTYLGSEISTENNIGIKLQKILIVANKCYYGLLKCLRSGLLSRKMKVTLYKTLIKPVLLYASET